MGSPAPQLERDSRVAIDLELQGKSNMPTHSQDGRILVVSSGDDDPLDPRNWPLLSRCKNIAILSLLIFVQGWAGAASSIANSAASSEFHVGNVAENLATAMYLFGISAGSLFVGPLSETVGRNPTYLVSTFFYLMFVLGSALTPTFGGQVVCRFLVGLFASATLAINGSSVRDQFHPVKRAFVFPIIAWANVASPVLAPVAGGWIVSNDQLGWRWTEWVTLMISSGSFFIALLFSSLSGFDYIFKHTYHLSTGMTGLCFAAIAAGATTFTLCAPALYLWARISTDYVRRSSVKPEFRLWPAILTAPLLPVSLFWLGWANYPSISIWCGLGACFLLGMVLIAIYVSTYEYIIDSYGDHSAIALASITMVRYMIAGGMVIAARPMYEGIGVHWTLTLLGCIAVILTPAPLLFWHYGGSLRKKSPYAKGDDEI